MPEKPSLPSALTHSQDRIVERYGFFVAPQELVRAIETGLAIAVSPDSNGCWVYQVPVDNGGVIVHVKVVYAAPAAGYATGRIISVLPQGTHAFRKQRERQDHDGQRKRRFAKDFRRINDEEDFDS